MKQWKQSILFKIQSKLHKFLLKVAYFLEIKPEVISELPTTELFVYRCFGDSINDLSSIPYPSENLISEPLPNYLIIVPGLYCVDGQLFNLELDGLYRFYALGRISEQRIICQAGIESLLRTLGYLWCHGNYDAKLNHQLLREQTLKRKIIIHCGISSFLCQNILQEFGYKSRVVISLTLYNWNQYDNGHTMVEVYHERLGWIVYDQSFSCIFKYNNKFLSLIELTEVVKQNKQYMIEFLTKSDKSGIFQDYGFDFGFWVEHRILSEKALRNWYHRVLGVPMIYNDDESCFYVTGSNEIQETILKVDKRLFGYKIIYLNQDVFDQRFYGEDNDS